jgi:hypothetical protein
MQDLLRRIWRYLNYPPATHGKVEEISQQVREICQEVRKLSEGLPPVEKLVTDVEKFKVKITAVENDIRYLKTLTIAVQNQLNSIQDHLRSSQAWLPSQPGLLDKPASLLLAHLAGFLQDPFVVEIGLHDGPVLKRLLDAGFSGCLLEPKPAAAAKLREQLGQNARLQVFESGAEALVALAETGKIPTDSAVLRITNGGFGLAVTRQLATLRPEIVEIALVAPLERPFEENPGNLVWPSEESVRDMRAQGYRWSLLLFEIKGEPAVRFAVNLIALPDAALGSFFFFKDSRLFDEAYRWSQTLLPRFQHRPGLQNSNWMANASAPARRLG